jgi:hypothetical protein
MHEGDRASILGEATTQEKVLQAQSELPAVGEPPAHGLALGLDAVTSSKLD